MFDGLNKIQSYGPNANLEKLFIQVEENLAKKGAANQFKARMQTAFGAIAQVGAAIENVGYLAVNLVTLIPWTVARVMAKEGNTAQKVAEHLFGPRDLKLRIARIFACTVGALFSAIGFVCPQINLAIQTKLWILNPENAAIRQMERDHQILNSFGDVENMNGLLSTFDDDLAEMVRQRTHLPDGFDAEIQKLRDDWHGALQVFTFCYDAGIELYQKHRSQELAPLNQEANGANPGEEETASSEESEEVDAILVDIIGDAKVLNTYATTAKKEVEKIQSAQNQIDAALKRAIKEAEQMRASENRAYKRASEEKRNSLFHMEGFKRRIEVLQNVAPSTHKAGKARLEPAIVYPLYYSDGEGQ